MAETENLTKNQKKIKVVEERLALYYAREKEMLAGGVQSYGIGSRNMTRYNTDLNAVRSAIEELENELAELEAVENGGKPRKAVGIVLRDW